jgi:hypothetical protein
MGGRQERETSIQMEGVQMSEPIYFSTNSHPISNPTTQIMRVDLDGGFTVNESIPATDAAKEVLRIMKEQWFADAQATKIRELQSDVNELKELVEYLQDRIKLMKSTGDELLEWLKDGAISDSNYRLLANAWQRAKENKR